MRQTAAGEGCLFHLLSSPSAMSYYTHAGLEKFDTCFEYGVYSDLQQKVEPFL